MSRAPEHRSPVDRILARAGWRPWRRGVPARAGWRLWRVEILRRPAWWTWRAIGPIVAAAVLVGSASLLAACGGSNGAGLPGSRAQTTTTQLLAYAHCMRGHGVADFPDPTGRGFAILQHGAGGDLNGADPTFVAANQACRALIAGEQRSAPPSSQKLAAEVRWARCLRAHGVPGFPDPNAQGAFDSAKFDDGAPAFQRASRACNGVEPAGPVTAVPGRS